MISSLIITIIIKFLVIQPKKQCTTTTTKKDKWNLKTHTYIIIAAPFFNIKTSPLIPDDEPNYWPQIYPDTREPVRECVVRIFFCSYYYYFRFLRFAIMGTRSLFMVGSFEMLLTTQNIYFLLLLFRFVFVCPIGSHLKDGKMYSQCMFVCFICMSKQNIEVQFFFLRLSPTYRRLTHAHFWSHKIILQTNYSPAPSAQQKHSPIRCFFFPHKTLNFTNNYRLGALGNQKTI